MNALPNPPISLTNCDLICFSHLRWDFVYQRPQHLMRRFERDSRVFFFEEPVFSDRSTHLNVSKREDRLYIVTPNIFHGDTEQGVVNAIQRKMVDNFLIDQQITDYLLWFYNPMAMDFADHLLPVITVFDCMDELSGFKFAPAELRYNESRLMEKADIVFTGGQSLFDAKQHMHANVFPFPSSIDVRHFKQARGILPEPADQAGIPHPRFGFCGVIDERMNTSLLGELAAARPDWQFVMVGPVLKISDDDLPKADNIHYLGRKNYIDLPNYLAGWDAALMPFAMNESTRFISPTKTPEYLAAGLPVISTEIADVVRPYGELGLVEIAKTTEGFIAAAEKIFQGDRSDLLVGADKFLSHTSWDKTWNEMLTLINEEIATKHRSSGPPRGTVSQSTDVYSLKVLRS